MWGALAELAIGVAELAIAVWLAYGLLTLRRLWRTLRGQADRLLRAAEDVRELDAGRHAAPPRQGRHAASPQIDHAFFAALELDGAPRPGG